MKDFFYLKVIRKTIIQFLDLFNNIKIAKYDESGNIIKYVTVPIKLGPKEKIYYWLNDRKDVKVMPIIGVQLSGINHDINRISNKNATIEVVNDNDENLLTKYLNPVPYNLEFSLNLLCQYMTEADQILEQILVYFNPFVFIRINIPELDAVYQVKVILNSCTPDISTDMTEEDYRLLIWNINFTVHGYLFQPKIEYINIIKTIITKFYTNEDNWDTYRSTETTYTSGNPPDNHEDESLVVYGWKDEDEEILSRYEVFT